MNRQITTLCGILLDLKKIENKQSILVFSDKHVVTKQALLDGEKYSSFEGEQRIKDFNLELHNRLIKLDITCSNNDIIANELELTVKNKIIDECHNTTGIAKDIVDFFIKSSLPHNIDSIDLTSILRRSLDFLSKKNYEDIMKYQHAMIQYRQNGLEIYKKNSIVIGSSLIDNDGIHFNKNTSVFFNFRYADFNGDIMHTIDYLYHPKVEKHHQFDRIVFTYVPGDMFYDVKSTCYLFMKLYNLLKKHGVILIMSGMGMHKDINSNSKFKKKILLNIGFKEHNIKLLDRCNLYKEHTSLLNLFTSNSLIFKDADFGLCLLIKK